MLFLEIVETPAAGSNGDQVAKQEVQVEHSPNPFSGTTTIRFVLADPRHVTLKVFDMLGREIVTLVNSLLPPGQHSVVFSAGDLPSGVYYYRLQAGGWEHRILIR